MLAIDGKTNNAAAVGVDIAVPPRKLCDYFLCDAQSRALTHKDQRTIINVQALKEKSLREWRPFAGLASHKFPYFLPGR